MVVHRKVLHICQATSNLNDAITSTTATKGLLDRMLSQGAKIQIISD